MAYAKLFIDGIEDYFSEYSYRMLGFRKFFGKSRYQMIRSIDDNLYRSLVHEICFAADESVYETLAELEKLNLELARMVTNNTEAFEMLDKLLAVDKS